ncbi:MAG: TylF/MycF/NovP-related O-methyltransferase [Chitinophagaceae bacterium]
MPRLLERICLKYLNKKYVLLQKDKLTYYHDLLYTYHNADFLKDPKFQAAYALSKSMDSEGLLKNYDIEWRIHVLCWAAEYASNLEGDFIDFGCRTGIFARAIHHFIDLRSLNKKYYMLDTFSGLDSRFSSGDELNSSLNVFYKKENTEQLYNSVLMSFAKFPVKVIKGAVPETLSQVDTTKLAFVSVDMNSVEPEVAALEFCWHKLVPGGIIVLDDYGYNNQFNAQKKAHDKFAESKGVNVLNVPTCQGIIIKPR